MKIGELSERSGVSVKNLRFYQRAEILREGQDFDEADVSRMQRVRVLRAMGIPLDEVVLLSKDRAYLEDVLLRQHYDGLRDDVSPWVKGTAKALLEGKAGFDGFDPAPFLADIPPEPMEGRLPYANCSWRRYFARILDINVYYLLSSALLAVFRIWRGAWYVEIPFALSGILFMLLLEPLLLHFTGWTPGKAVFGLKLRMADGKKLPLKLAYSRVYSVFSVGMGYWFIPIYDYYRLYHSWKDCREGFRMEWDFDGESVPLRYTAPEYVTYFRQGLWVVLNLLVAGLAVLMMLFELTPFHTGRVTLEEFTENMNRYIQYDARLKGDSPFLSAGYPPFLLDREGNWEEGPEPAGHVLVQFNMNGDVREWVPPEYAYALEDGWVTSVSFTDVRENVAVADLNQEEIEWIVLSLSGDWCPVDNLLTISRLREVMDGHIRQNYSFEAGGCTVRWEVSMEGFDETSIGYLSDDENGSYVQTVTVTKR